MKKYLGTADWNTLEKRPTWATCTTRELSEVLGVSLQTLHNWLSRGDLPKPEPRRSGQGNKHRFKISKIRAMLESNTEENIHWEFINAHMGTEFKSIEQAMWNAERYWRAYGIEKPI